MFNGFALYLFQLSGTKSVAVWPDLTKFRYFVYIFRTFGNFGGLRSI